VGIGEVEILADGLGQDVRQHPVHIVKDIYQKEDADDIIARAEFHIFG
jgi:hypothetical protein